MDAVYTWVNGSDSKHLASRQETQARHGVAAAPHSLSANRFRYLDQLRYSLRSIDLYAPWIERIFLVTADQKPDWLVQNHPRLRLVSHSDMFRDRSHLPTFNNRSIECHFHEIPGLGDPFIYFNDDMCLLNRVSVDHFIDRNGRKRIYEESWGYEPEDSPDDSTVGRSR